MLVVKWNNGRGTFWLLCFILSLFALVGTTLLFSFHVCSVPGLMLISRSTAPAVNMEGYLQSLRRWSRQRPAVVDVRCLCTSRTSSSRPQHKAIFSEVAFHWHLHRLDGTVAAVLPTHCFFSRDASFTPFRRRWLSPVDGRQQSTGVFRMHLLARQDTDSMAQSAQPTRCHEDGLRGSDESATLHDK